MTGLLSLQNQRSGEQPFLMHAHFSSSTKILNFPMSCHLSPQLMVPSTPRRWGGSFSSEETRNKALPSDVDSYRAVPPPQWQKWKEGLTSCHTSTIKWQSSWQEMAPTKKDSHDRLKPQVLAPGSHLQTCFTSPSSHSWCLPPDSQIVPVQGAPPLGFNSLSWLFTDSPEKPGFRAAPGNAWNTMSTFRSSHYKYLKAKKCLDSVLGHAQCEMPAWAIPRVLTAAQAHLLTGSQTFPP